MNEYMNDFKQRQERRLEREAFERFIRDENDRMEKKRRQNNNGSFVGNLFGTLLFMILFVLYWILKFIIAGLIIIIPTVLYFLPTIIGFWKNKAGWRVLGFQLLVLAGIVGLLFVPVASRFIIAGILMLLVVSLAGSISIMDTTGEEVGESSQGLIEPREWTEYSHSRIELKKSKTRAQMEFEKYLDKDYPK